MPVRASRDDYDCVCTFHSSLPPSCAGSLSFLPLFLQVVFPNSAPSPVSWVYFINRVSTGCGPGNMACEWRVYNGTGNVTLHSPAGGVIQSPIIGPSPATTFTYDAPLGAISPDPAAPFQTNATNRLLKVRHITTTRTLERRS